MITTTGQLRDKSFFFISKKAEKIPEWLNIKKHFSNNP